jgi:hypothetical protein
VCPKLQQFAQGNSNAQVNTVNGRNGAHNGRNRLNPEVKAGYLHWVVTSWKQIRQLGKVCLLSKVIKLRIAGKYIFNKRISRMDEEK